MKTETQKLASLVSLALQKNALIPVTATEMLGALNGMETAMEMMLASDTDPFEAKHNLYNAARVLACLIYSLANNAPCAGFRDNKTLVNRINALQAKLGKALNWFCNVSAFGACRLLSFKSLLKNLHGISESLQEHATEAGLFELVHAEISALQKEKNLPYHRWLWWSQFAAATRGACTTNARPLENILINLNFNTPGFINWLSDNLDRELETFSTAAGKLELLKTQVLRYKLLQHCSRGYLLFEKPVKQVMLLMLQLQLQCIKAFPGTYTEQPKAFETRLNTVLSVPQLALLVRLMVDAKIINENNQQALLKHVAAIVSTSKAASVSSKSLRVNYYSPNTAAKNIVHDYLLQMIKLLRTY